LKLIKERKKYDAIMGSDLICSNFCCQS